MYKKHKAALIGSGDISHIYLENMVRRFNVLDLVGCSDIIPERSRSRAEEFGIQQLTNEQILADPSIDIVINTTYPTAHYEVSRAALEAGKHVFSEKMIAVELDEGRELMRLASSRGLWLCVAPDTFLGAGLQTVRKLIDAGMIGEVLQVNAMVIRGYLPTMESADYAAKPMFFKPGGGIPFDMGGYYLNAMMSILGGLKRVSGFVRTREPLRPYTNARNPEFMNNMEYETINHLSAALEFESGVYGTLVCASDAYAERPRLEFFGTEGSIVYEDPNSYGARVLLSRKGQSYEYVEMPFTHGFSTNSRGIGPAELAWSLNAGRKPRTEAQMGFHSFEAIHGIWQSSRDGKVYEMTSRCERPAPLPSGYVLPQEEEAALAL